MRAARDSARYAVRVDESSVTKGLYPQLISEGDAYTEFDAIYMANPDIQCVARDGLYKGAVDQASVPEFAAGKGKEE